ncbi:MAG: M56 family metallopeptidase [Thermoanaerobaculia bacterium]
MIATTSLASLLTWLMEATVKGSLLILLVVALNAVIGSRLDARWRHLLWIIVIVRLALPAAPASPLSLFNLLPADDHIVRASGAVEGVRVALPQAPLPHASFVRLEPSPVIVFARWIAAIWLIGFLALTFRALVATLRTRRAVTTALRHATPNPDLDALLDEGRRRLGIRRRIRIVECSAIRTPALHGAFRPVLLLPSGLAGSFSTEELRHVILHELWHLRRMDVAVSWALSAVQAVHWFNPLVWLAASRIREERELACDELALSCLEDDERSGYGRTVLKLLESFQTAAPVPALVGIVNGKQKMKRRLTMIASFRNRARFSLLLLLVVAAVGVAALTDATAGEQRKFVWHNDPAALPTIEKMHQPVSFELSNATFADFLATAGAKGGITLMQDPEIAALPVQQARFTIKAENVPLHAVLMEALMPFELVGKPTANGVTIGKGEGHLFIAHAGGEAKHEEQVETSEDGKKRVEKRVMVFTGNDGKHVTLDGHGDENLPPGAVKREVMMKARVHAGKASFDENGRLHRELTLKMNENGTESEGKLSLDIQK